MKQLLFTAQIFYFLVLVSCTPVVNLEEEEASVRLTLNGYIESWAEKDISGFKDIFITDETLTIYEGRHIFKGWEAWKDRLVKSFSSVEKVDVHFSNTIVHVSPEGNAAWINTIENATWLDNGEQKQVTDMRVSWGLRKVGEKWKIVQGHWSVP